MSKLIFLKVVRFVSSKILNSCAKLYVWNCRKWVSLFFILLIENVNGQIIYQHDFGTTTIDTNPYNVAPTVFDPTLSNSSWSNTTGSWTDYNGSSGKAIALKNGTGNPVITLTFDVAQDYELSITQFNFWSQRSSTGPSDWSMTINGIPVGSGTVPTTGTDLGNTNVSNTASGFTGSITLQITLTGATSSVGTFRLDDFTLIGTVSPVTTYYRSRQNGNWSTPSTWEYSDDNSNWNVSSKSPTSDAENILIQNGHTVSVSDTVSLDQTTIAGTLQLQTGGVLNINDGSGDDITISDGGILQIISGDDYSFSVQQDAAAGINIATGGKIKIGDGSSSTGDGYESLATSTTNIWNDGAIYEYDVDKAFEAPGLTYFPNVDENTVPVFMVSAVAGTPGSGSSSDFHLNGILELNTDLTFSGTGDKYLRDGVKGNYTLTQTGSGQICLNGLSPVLEGDSLKIVLKYNLQLITNTEIPSGSYVMVSGSNLNNNYNKTDGTVFTINGTLDVTDQGIKNTHGSIILNAIFRTANGGGFSGSGASIPSGDIAVNPGSTIELYADGDQDLNARDDFSNLIFSGSGTKTPKGSFSPAGTVTIKDDAVFDCSGRNIGDETESGPTATNLTMSGNSRLIVDTYGPNPKMAGTYNLTGGVVEFAGSNGTVETIRSKNYQNIEVTGTNVGMSDGNIILNTNGTFTVKNGGVFSINDNTIKGTGDGTQRVIVESGGDFKCGNNLGFNGATITSIPIQSSAINEDIEDIVLEPNSTVEYTRDRDSIQPITNANGLVYQNLILSGSDRKVAPSGDLIIQGNFSKTSGGDFIHNNGTVIFNGSDEQTYSCVSPQMIFYNLTNKNTFGLNINDSLSVYYQLSIDNATTNLNADITLLSSKDQAAGIGQLSTNAIINYYEGRFIFEHYINTNSSGGGHQKSWQFLSTPVFGQTIYDSWQEGGSKTVSGYGTWITAPGGVTNGFDAESPAPSIKYYDPASNGWIGVTSTNTELANEKGYMLFVRGDRLANSVNATPTPTILRIRGKLYSPAFLPLTSTVPAGMFQSVGNPYASAIDFEKISSSNIQSSYYAWDPDLGGAYGYGGYQTISAATGYLAVPGGTSNYKSTSSYQYIQSGQAFFVNNYTSSDGTVGFTENCKVTGHYHLTTRESENEKAILFADLVLPNETLLDGNAASFSKDFSDRIDREDVKKIAIPGENFVLDNSGQIFVVEARNQIHSGDTLFYRLNNLKPKEYKIVFAPRKINSTLEAWLTDNFLHREKQISLTDTSYIEFSVTADKASSNPKRFYLVFRASAGPLALSFVSMNAEVQDNDVIISWQVENENEVKNYEVEYSKDGIHFSSLGVVAAMGNISNKYSFSHHQPDAGSGFYRIKINKFEGELAYQKILKVVIPEKSASIQIYPNPIQERIINVRLKNQPLGKYAFKLYNDLGQELFLKQINYKGEPNVLLSIGKNLSAGIYQLETIKPNGERKSLQVKIE